MEPLNPAPQAVIFDLDGTLADTFDLIVSAWNAAVTPHTGKTYSPQDVISRFGIPDSAMIRQELPSRAGDVAVETYHAHYESAHHLVKPFKGIHEMLAGLRRRGVPMALVTGKGRRSAEITLRRLEWQSVFEIVITGEDVTHQKPAPEGLLLVARKLGVATAECIFVGDSPADIGAGKAARIRTVAAGWHDVYADKIRAMQPDVWANSPADLLRLCGIAL